MPNVKTLVSLESGSGEPWEELWTIPDEISTDSDKVLKFCQQVIDNFNHTSTTPREKIRKLVKVLEVIPDEDTEEDDDEGDGDLELENTECKCGWSGSDDDCDTDENDELCCPDCGDVL